MQRIAAKFKVSLQLQDMHITHRLHPLHHLFYITYIHPHLHTSSPASFTSSTSSTSSKGGQHVHICHKTRRIVQKWLHRSSYTRVVAQELRHSSCYTGVVTPERLVHLKEPYLLWQQGQPSHVHQNVTLCAETVRAGRPIMW